MACSLLTIPSLQFNEIIRTFNQTSEARQRTGAMKKPVRDEIWFTENMSYFALISFLLRMLQRQLCPPGSHSALPLAVNLHFSLQPVPSLCSCPSLLHTYLRTNHSCPPTQHMQPKSQPDHPCKHGPLARQLEQFLSINCHFN